MNHKDYWLVIALTLSASLLGGAISAQLYMSKTIDAEEITFSDSARRIRAKFVLGIHGEPGLALYDEGGQPRITLGLGSAGEPSIKLLDNNSKIIWSAP